LETCGCLTAEANEAEPLRASIVRPRLASARGETELTELAHEVEIRSVRQEMSDLKLKVEIEQSRDQQQMAEERCRHAKPLRGSGLSSTEPMQRTRPRSPEADLADMRQSTRWRIPEPLCHATLFVCFESHQCASPPCTVIVSQCAASRNSAAEE
jgi:hypothetical protein